MGEIYFQALFRELFIRRVLGRFITRTLSQLPDVSNDSRKQTQAQHLVYGNMGTHRACVPVLQPRDKIPGCCLQNTQGLRRCSLYFSGSDGGKPPVRLFPEQVILEAGVCICPCDDFSGY